MAALGETASKTAGIIGGGTGGSGLLRFLLQSDRIKVVFVVDRDPEASGLKLAAQSDIPVFTDLDEALAKVPCQMLFEMTGVPAVKVRLLQFMKDTAIELMPSSTWVLIQELEEAKRRATGAVTQEILGIKERLTSGLEGSQNLVGRINHIMSSMQMLALNASIEAAKVGVHGRGFAVVAEHMTKSVENVRKLTEDIGKVNGDIQQVSGQINTAISHLE
jgi:predicted dinucleotide-utilizing enzyme